MEIFIEYFVPILILVGFGALLAFALSFLSFRLDQEAQEDEINKHLPGINCGGCGYGGCRKFADALLKGDANVDMCAPLKEPQKQNIAQILNEQ